MTVTAQPNHSEGQRQRAESSALRCRESVPWASGCAPSLTTKMEEMKKSSPDALSAVSTVSGLESRCHVIGDNDVHGFPAWIRMNPEETGFWSVPGPGPPSVSDADAGTRCAPPLSR